MDKYGVYHISVFDLQSAMKCEPRVAGAVEARKYIIHNELHGKIIPPTPTQKTWSQGLRLLSLMIIVTAGAAAAFLMSPTRG